MSETDLVKSILQAVNFYGYFWRNNTGATKIDSSRGSRFIRFGMPGSADIIGVCEGRLVAIEAKNGKGRQSEQQKIFERNIVMHGACYILAYNVDDALRVILKLKKDNKMELSKQVEQLDGVPLSKKQEIQSILNEVTVELRDVQCQLLNLKAKLKDSYDKIASLEEEIKNNSANTSGYSDQTKYQSKSKKKPD